MIDFANLIFFDSQICNLSKFLPQPPFSRRRHGDDGYRAAGRKAAVIHHSRKSAKSKLFSAKGVRLVRAHWFLLLAGLIYKKKTEKTSRSEEGESFLPMNSFATFFSHSYKTDKFPWIDDFRAVSLCVSRFEKQFSHLLG